MQSSDIQQSQLAPHSPQLSLSLSLTTASLSLSLSLKVIALLLGLVWTLYIQRICSSPTKNYERKCERESDLDAIEKPK